MVFLCHLPKIILFSVLTLVGNCGMASPAHIKRVLTYSGLKRDCNPVRVTAAWSTLVVSVICNVIHLLLWKKAERCMLLLALCYQRFATWCRIDSTSHTLGWPDYLCHFYYPLTLLLWFMKSRVKKLVVAHVYVYFVMAR